MNYLGQATNAANAKYGSFYNGFTARLKNNKQATAFLNATDASIELDYAAQIFTSRFTWEGDAIKDYPNGYIERTVFFSGFCVGFIHERYGFLILPAYAATFNVIGEPSQVVAQGYSEVFSLNPGEYCILKDNNTYTCPAWVIERKSSLVADCGRTIETYLQGMKNNIMIVTDDKNKLTNQKIAEQIVHNNPYILASSGKKAVGPEDTPPIFHNSPHTGNDLMCLLQAKKTLVNDMLGKIGIDCNGVGKGQYQSESEIENETFFTNLLNKQAHDCRQQFRDDVEEKFGILLHFTNNVEAEKVALTENVEEEVSDGE